VYCQIRYEKRSRYCVLHPPRLPPRQLGPHSCVRSHHPCCPRKPCTSAPAAYPNSQIDFLLLLYYLRPSFILPFDAMTFAGTTRQRTLPPSTRSTSATPTLQDQATCPAMASPLPPSPPFSPRFPPSPPFSPRLPLPLPPFLPASFSHALTVPTRQRLLPTRLLKRSPHLPLVFQWQQPRDVRRRHVKAAIRLSF
jgi:hypothetical protein